MLPLEALNLILTHEVRNGLNQGKQIADASISQPEGVSNRRILPATFPWDRGVAVHRSPLG